MTDLNSNITWPKRAVVTAGMPYGNKSLHFGHIGGVFIPADAYARFLRDRIGASNVRFVSGTDCYGSPIDEGYRRACESGFDGSILDYVTSNHDSQVKALDAFDISLDIFEGSAIGHAGKVHQEVSTAFVTSLYEQGHLKLESTMQFYDEQSNMFLNGRQVKGRCCPVQGCKAQNAYADECDLGHQYSPCDLEAPVSSVSGTTPVMRPVNNWYFDLPSFKEFLNKHAEMLVQDDSVRPNTPTAISAFLGAPIIFVKNESYDEYLTLLDKIPPHTYTEAEKGKSSFELQFNSIEDRDIAKAILASSKIRFRTSKTLVPFRITGNIKWGVKAPVLDGVEDLTIWCWPESLWAPISFTIAANDALGLPKDTWQDFWCADDSCVYQFIGEDNIYFYGVAQPAMFEALGTKGVFGQDNSLPLNQTTLIANHHLLYGNTKASSSGEVKPPSADDLLEHYTSDELRAHFLALGLNQKSVKFAPKPFDPALSEEEKNDTRRADPALKEGALLTNIFNRFARSCFYEASKNFDSHMPIGEVSQDIYLTAKDAMAAYEACMYATDLHSAQGEADKLIRFANKYWSDEISKFSNCDTTDDEENIARRQLLVDCFFLLRVCSILMHPIAPKGCETICEYLNLNTELFFNWVNILSDASKIFMPEQIRDSRHLIKELPPKFDFFPKHPSRFK